MRATSELQQSKIKAALSSIKSLRALSKQPLGYSPCAKYLPVCFSSAASPKFWEEPNILTLSEQQEFFETPPLEAQNDKVY